MVTTLRGEDAKKLRHGFWKVWWYAVALLRGGMGSVAISVAARWTIDLLQRISIKNRIAS
jgi:hypothetical protein